MEKESILDLVNLFSDYFDISKSETNRLLDSGGLYLNYNRIIKNRHFTFKDFVDGKAILRKGKKDFRILDIKEILV